MGVSMPCFVNRQLSFKKLFKGREREELKMLMNYTDENLQGRKTEKAYLKTESIHYIPRKQGTNLMHLVFFYFFFI